MNTNTLLRKKALQVSIGRFLRGNFWSERNLRNRGVRESAPMYKNGMSNRNFENRAFLTWNTFHKLNKEIKDQLKKEKHVATIVNRIIAKNKERINHNRSGDPKTSIRSNNWFNKYMKIRTNLRKLEDELLYGVAALNKIKRHKAAAGARGRSVGRAAMNTFEYRPAAPKIGNFGGKHYRSAKRQFNMMTGKIANAETSPRRNASPKSVSPRRGMKHAMV